MSRTEHNLTDLQKSFLTKVLDSNLFDLIGNKIANFSKGNDAFQLIRDSRYWHSSLVVIAITEVLEVGGYDNTRKPMLDSVGVYWKRNFKLIKL